MSSDNGIYVLHSKDGYRIAHLQAIENLWWWESCCNNPNVVEQPPEDDLYYREKCLNCGTEQPAAERKDDICPKRLKELFGDCEVFATSSEAFAEAEQMYNKIINDDMGIGIVEYGIQTIEYDKEFPK